MNTESDPKRIESDFITFTKLRITHNIKTAMILNDDNIDTVMWQADLLFAMHIILKHPAKFL